MPLTDTAIRNIKPAEKPVKVFDEPPAGGKWWRFRYRFGGKHRTLSMGVYPDVGFKTAYNRTAHLDERRKMMQQWADYLDKLKAGADVIPLRGNQA